MSTPASKFRALSFGDAVENVAAWDNIRTFAVQGEPWSVEDYRAARAEVARMAGRCVALMCDMDRVLRGEMERDAFADKYPDV